MLRAASLLLIFAVAGCATAPREVPVPVRWDLAAAEKAAYRRLDRRGAPDGVRKIAIESRSFRGRETKVFGYLALPADAAERPAPGVVLLHGEGGSAFRSWAEEWAEMGYAALAIDLCGAIPGGEYGDDEFSGHRRSPVGGPSDCGGRATVGEAVTDQWPYHAVEAALRAGAVLRGLAEVDAGKVGLVGVDWGGFVAALAASVERRFAFAVVDSPRGFVPSPGRRPSENRAWRELWSPWRYLPNARCPLLWIAETNDAEFPVDVLGRARGSAAAAPGRLSIHTRVVRASGVRKDLPREAAGFADDVTGTGPGFPRCVRTEFRGGTAAATFDLAGREATMAVFAWTTGKGPWADRRWKSFPVDLGEDGAVSAPVPEDATGWSFSVFFDGGSVISSDVGSR